MFEGNHNEQDEPCLYPVDGLKLSGLLIAAPFSIASRIFQKIYAQRTLILKKQALTS